MRVARLNGLEALSARAELARCCGASRWVDAMVAARPFASEVELFARADAEWARMERADVLEAFAHHPRIGDVPPGKGGVPPALREKFASTAGWASGEQSGTADANEAVLHALHEGNRAYETRYGHIFIVCATGKSAQQMLDLLRARMDNAPDRELAIAAAEQAKITRLRMEKLLAGS